MAEHPLHEAVGELLKEFATEEKYDLILDHYHKNHDEKHRISLFYDKSKKLETRLCCVDAMLLKYGKVRVVIEIEESNITPTQICGKFLTSALADSYIYKKEEPISINKSIAFIQILDTSSLKENSQKPEQFKIIEKAIKKNLHNYYSIQSYDIISIDKKSENLKEELKDKLSKILKEVL